MSLEANVYPILLRVGDFTLYSYGVIVVLAIVVGGYVARRLLKHLGLDPGLATELAGAAALGGFAGARLYWLAEHWSEVRADVLHHAFAGAGFTWYGGLLGGVAAVISVAIFRRVPLGIVANVMAPAVALGYAHGVVPTTIRVQPTPVYETLSMVVVFLILYRLARRPQPGWFVFSWFLVLSGVERFAVEFLRRNPVWVAGLTPPQWFALASVAIGAFVLLAMRVRHARLEAEPSHPAA